MLPNNSRESTITPEFDDKFWDYFNMDVTPMERNNETVGDVTVPAPEQGFVVGIYSVLLVTGAVGNIAVFVTLVRARRRKSRVNLLMTHLAVADMMVIFIEIPLEIGWRTTNAWLAGNLACKLFLVLRAFGLYLSSNVLVCISFDRYFAVLHPLRLAIARKRSKMMLLIAWITAFLFSLAQSLVFRVMRHPNHPEFEQCVSFGAFSSQEQELAYNIFCLCAMYFVPLLIISVCYAYIFYEISKNSKEISDKSPQEDHSQILLRRSDRRPLARARRRTLRMTVTIVSVFFCCWLPYATMTLWYMLDRQSAVNVSPRVQDLFFIMAVSNSCMNPLVYGSYALDLKSVFSRTLRKVLCIHTRPSVQTRSTTPGSLKNKLHSKDVPTENIRLKRLVVRFEENSLAAPSACSDPMPCCSERYATADVLKPSRSCELFTVHAPRYAFVIESECK